MPRGTIKTFNPKVPLKPEQQANGKRRFKFTKASQAQPSTAKNSQHSPAQPCATLHGPRYLFALFSAACCTCTALVVYSLSFRLPASLARPLLSFRSLFGRLLRSARPSLSFRSLFGRLLRLHGPRYLSFSFRTSWAPLGSVFAALGRSWVTFWRPWGSLGRSWAALGRSWEALGRLLAALGAILERHAKINEKSMPKITDFGSLRAPFWEPKSDPRPTKIEDKNRCEKNTS